jgi:hypothetical protein
VTDPETFRRRIEAAEEELLKEVVVPQTELWALELLQSLLAGVMAEDVPRLSDQEEAELMNILSKMIDERRA